MKAHMARLKKLSGPEMINLVGAALLDGGQLIEADAITSISDDNKNGSIYTHEFVTINGRPVPIRERSKPHQASAPGEAPAEDAGDLIRGIDAVSVAPLVVEVSSHAPYSKYLEFGTSKIAARPFMGPARDRNKKAIVEKVQKAVNVAIKRSKSNVKD